MSLVSDERVEELLEMERTLDRLQGYAQERGYESVDDLVAAHDEMKRWNAVARKTEAITKKRLVDPCPDRRYDEVYEQGLKWQEIAEEALSDGGEEQESPEEILGTAVNQALRALPDYVVTCDWRSFTLTFEARRVHNITYIYGLRLVRTPECESPDVWKPNNDGTWNCPKCGKLHQAWASICDDCSNLETWKPIYPPSEPL